MSGSFDTPSESRFDQRFQLEGGTMQSNEELARVNAALMHMAIGLAAQLALMDGGSFTTVRAVGVRTLDDLGIDALSDDTPEGFTVTTVIQEAVLSLMRNGIETRR